MPVEVLVDASCCFSQCNHGFLQRLFPRRPHFPKAITCHRHCSKSTLYTPGMCLSRSLVSIFPAPQGASDLTKCLMYLFCTRPQIGQWALVSRLLYNRRQQLYPYIPLCLSVFLSIITMASNTLFQSCAIRCDIQCVFATGHHYYRHHYHKYQGCQIFVSIDLTRPGDTFPHYLLMSS